MISTFFIFYYARHGLRSTRAILQNISLNVHHIQSKLSFIGRSHGLLYSIEKSCISPEIIFQSIIIVINTILTVLWYRKLIQNEYLKLPVYISDSILTNTKERNYKQIICLFLNEILKHMKHIHVQ